jgi:hypothetical protein
MIRTRGMTLPLLCLWALARSAAAQELQPGDVLGHDVEITVQQAVGLGLANNLNLQIIRNDPEAARERVREAQGAFNPNLTGNFLQNHTETPVASSLQAFFGTVGDRTEDNSKNYSGLLNGILPYGPLYSSGYTFQDLSSTSGLISLKPQYTAAWVNALTIPLLRDLYWSTPDYLVRRAKLDQQISDSRTESPWSRPRTGTCRPGARSRSRPSRPWTPPGSCSTRRTCSIRWARCRRCS